ncbi:MAG: PAS domain S-box protein [Desulfobacula sp.]|jgi:PAS domain S-box-containing protein|nr:PAS domain S-box protein [Desulfobacula sp.]
MTEKPTYEELEKKIQELEQSESNLERSKEQLIHSQDLMDYILFHARSAIAVFDRDFKYVYVSKRYLKDYKVKDQNIIGKHHYEVFPDLPQKWREVHQRSLAGEVLRAEEDPYYREDGSIDWTCWECRPWYESDGSIGGIIIYTEVINERKKVEEALRESEHKLSTHLQNTPVGATSWDLNFKTIEWNPAAETIFGYTKDEALGKHVTELILPEDMKELVDGIFQDLISEKGGARSTNENITKDGRRIMCDWYNTALKDSNGRVVGLASLVHDITERMQTEEALKNSEEKYRTVLEANPDPVVVYDIEGKVIYFNPAFTRLFGWSLEECLNKKMEVFVPEDAWHETKKMIKKVLAGEWFSGIETWRYNKKGEIIPVSISGAIYKDKDGNPIGSVIDLRDISDQKKMEAQLKQAQKLESIGTLTGGIAHDFNNIMGIILGNTELALEDVPEWNSAHSNLEEIKTASLRAANIVRQLLSFTRITDQKLQPMEIALVIKDALKFLRSTIPTTIDI